MSEQFYDKKQLKNQLKNQNTFPMLWRKPIILILLLCLGSFILAGCSKAVIIAPTLQDPVQVKLDTEIVTKKTIYDIDLYDASVIPYTEGIFFNNECVLGEIMVGVGDKVTKGQTLLTLDRAGITKEYSSLKEEISYAEQNNTYINEQTDYDIEIAKIELSILNKNGTPEQIALKKLDIRALELQKSYTRKLQQLELDKKKEKLNQLDLLINYSDMTAPFDGTIVTMSNLHEGDTLQPYDPLVYIADDTKLTLQAEYISDRTIEASHKLYVMLEGSEYGITSIPLSDEEYKYRTYNGLALESNFIIDASDLKLKSGMYACIALVKNYAEDVLAVPPKAIYRDGAVRYVYKIVEGERVRQEIEAGISTQLLTQITSGLKEGDEVYVQQ